MKLDFMVCADLFMTPTAELADIVLPAASWPELDQVAGLPTVAANVVLAKQKAVQHRRVQVGRGDFRRAGAPDEAAASAPSRSKTCSMRSSRPAASTSPSTSSSRAASSSVPFKYRKYEDGGFKTPTGKIELYSTRLRADGLCAAALLRRAAGKPDQHARGGRATIRSCSRPAGASRSSSTPNTGRSKSCARRIAIRSPKSIPTRRRVRHRGRRLDVDRDAARPHQAEGASVTDRHRSARHRRRARLVVSRRGRRRTTASGSRMSIC